MPKCLSHYRIRTSSSCVWVMHPLYHWKILKSHNNTITHLLLLLLEDTMTHLTRPRTVEACSLFLHFLIISFHFISRLSRSRRLLRDERLISSDSSTSSSLLTSRKRLQLNLKLLKILLEISDDPLYLYYWSLCNSFYCFTFHCNFLSICKHAIILLNSAHNSDHIYCVLNSCNFFLHTTGEFYTLDLSESLIFCLKAGNSHSHTTGMIF